MSIFILILVWWLVGVIVVGIGVIAGNLKKPEPFRVKDLCLLFLFGLLGPCAIPLIACFLLDNFSGDIGNIVIWEPRKKKD